MSVVGWSNGVDLARLIETDGLAENSGPRLGIGVCGFCGLTFSWLTTDGAGEAGSGFRSTSSNGLLAAFGVGGCAGSSLAFAGCEMSWVRGISFWLPSILGLGLLPGSGLAAREFLLEYLSVSFGFMVDACLGSTWTNRWGSFFFFGGFGCAGVGWATIVVLGLGRGLMKSSLSSRLVSGFLARMMAGLRAPVQATIPQAKRCTVSDMATVDVRR